MSTASTPLAAPKIPHPVFLVGSLFKTLVGFSQAKASLGIPMVWDRTVFIFPHLPLDRQDPLLQKSVFR